MPPIRAGFFYSPWPLFGKKLSAQYPNLRINHQELHPIVTNILQDISDTDSDVRAIIGQYIGKHEFRNKFRIFYDESSTQLKIQVNQGTVDVPIWVDYLTIDEESGTVRSAVGGFDGGPLGFDGSEGGFYGILGGGGGSGSGTLQQILEVGSGANTSFLSPTKLGVNVEEGFYLSSKAGFPVLNLSTNSATTRPFSNVATLSVAHNFGQSPILAQVYDNKQELVIPERIDVSNPNTAYFYFGSNLSGQVILSTGGFGPRGPTGIQGPIGLQGPQGNTGPAGPGFYGMNVKHSDDSASFININTFALENSHFYITQNSPNTDEVQINLRGVAEEGHTHIVDHGTLTGLGDDDHTQYLLTSGSRAMAGALNMGNFRITNLGAPSVGTDAARASHTHDHGSELVGLGDNDHPQYLGRTSAANNDMTVDLDMGSNQITSLGAPSADDDAARLIDVIERGGNFYGVLFTETSGPNVTHERDDTLRVDSNFFYLSSSSDGKPILSLIPGATGGEVNTGVSLGGGDVDVFKQKNGLNLEFRSLIGGSNIVLSEDSNNITINSLAGSGFYGFTVAQTDSLAQFTGINKLNLDSTHFYITQNSPNTDEAIVGFRPDGLVYSSSNLGSGEGLATSKQSQDLPFKSLVAGQGIILSSDSEEVTISSPDLFYGVIFSETAPPVGQPSIFRDDTVRFDRGFFYLTSSNDGKPIVSLLSGAAGGGDITGGTSLPGGDVDVFKQKSGVDLQFRSLIGGSNIVLSEDANNITIDSLAGSGFYGLSFAHTDNTQQYTEIKKLNVNVDYFYLTQNTPNTDEAVLNFRPPSHSDLMGLDSDDHPQYLLIDGSRAMTGALDMGTNKITNLAEPTSDTDAARLQDVGPAFYGMIIKQSDDIASFSNIKVIGFDTNGFYVTQNAPNTDEVIVNIRNLIPGPTGPQGPAGPQGPQGNPGPTAFYGIDISQSDEAAAFTNITKLNFEATSFYITQNSPNTDEVVVNFRGTAGGGGGGGVTDHGALTGLSDDDHTQYLLVSGSRAMTGTLDMGNARIVNLGTPSLGTDAVQVNHSHDHGTGLTGLGDDDHPQYLGRTGAAQNDMTVALDMGSNQINNLGKGTSPNDAARLVDIRNAEFYLHDILDVNAPSATTGQVLQYSSGTWSPGPINTATGVYAANFSNAFEWQANHSIGSDRLVWSAYDSADRAITPDVVDISDPNIAYFYFPVETTGRVVILSGGSTPGAIGQSFTDSGEVIINHSFGTSDIIQSVVDDKGELILPHRADFSNPNTAYFYFIPNRTGRITLTSTAAAPLLSVSQTDGLSTLTGIKTLNVNSNHFYIHQNTPNEATVNLKSAPLDKAYSEFTNAVEVQLNHNLNTQFAVWSVYDTRGKNMNVERAILNDPNTAYFYFISSVSGRAVVIG